MGIDTRADAELDGASADGTGASFEASDGERRCVRARAAVRGAAYCVSRACDVPFVGGWEDEEEEETRLTDGSRRMVILLTRRKVFDGWLSVCFSLPFPWR